MNENEYPLLSAQEAADIIGITSRAVRKRAADRWVGVKVAGVWVFTRDDLEKLAKPGRVGRPPQKPCRIVQS